LLVGIRLAWSAKPRKSIQRKPTAQMLGEGEDCMGAALFNRVRESWPWLLTPLVVGIVTPALVLFTLQVLEGGRTLATAIPDNPEKFIAFSLLTAWCLIPFAILSALLLVQPANFPRRRIACLSIFGLLGILVLMVPAHWSVWAPLYTGEHMSSTATIVFVPLPFLCLVTMLPGLAIGWLVAKLPLFKAAALPSMRGAEPAAAAERPPE
jgi:hypothetical protein